MIACFPFAYPDELLYSQLARCYMKSSYTAYTHAAEDLFLKKTVKPSIEFVNAFTPDALQIITRDIAMEEVILKHTMFPYYGRFLPKEQRENAFQALISMRKNCYDLLSVPNNSSDSDRYLRYCPLCAEEDRETHGETFWHRIHQMIGLPSCPIHGCHLIDSEIVIGGRVSPILKPAEEVVPKLAVITKAYETENRLAIYMSEIFFSKVDFEFDIPIANFLHSRMINTKYCSVRGKRISIKSLHSDVLTFYKKQASVQSIKHWQIKNILESKRFNFYEICLLAMFLHISPAELIRLKLPAKSKQQLFDEEVYKLRKQGLNYSAISKRLHTSYNTVRSVGESMARSRV